MFPCIYQFCNCNLNKCIFLLRKSVYPSEDMDNWEKFDETTMPPKESFYSELNLEDIKDEDYAHGLKVWEVFRIKKIAANIMTYIPNVIHYCLQICLKTLEIRVMKYMDLILYILYLHQD